MFISTLILLCADGKVPDIDLLEDYQKRLMQQFVQNTGEAFIASIIPDGNLSHDVCSQWSGVKCNAFQIAPRMFMYRIIGVEYSDAIAGDFSISYLPSSVRIISIVRCNQHFSIDTRLLPRKLTHADFDENQIQGTLNLQRLPPRVVHFSIRNNFICGPIHLIDLPMGLHHLDLSENRIQQKRVYCRHLPFSLKYVHLNGLNHWVGSVVALPGGNGNFRSVHEVSFIGI